MASLASAPPLGPLPSSASSSLHGSPVLAPRSAGPSPSPPSQPPSMSTASAENAVPPAIASSPKREDAIESTAPSTLADTGSEKAAASVIDIAAPSADVTAAESLVAEVVATDDKAGEMPAEKVMEEEAKEEEDVQEDEEEEEDLEGLNDEEDEEKCCKLCNRKYDAPRILSCLHVFCTSCITNQIEGGAAGPKADFDDDDKVAHFGADDKSLAPETEKLLNGLTRLRQRKKSAAGGSDVGAQAVVITCPACQQETRLESGKTVEALPLDHVMAAMVRVNATEGDEEPVCTSCKDQGKAEASCQDCASFLCSQCVTAHRFMRCFENHSVVALDDIGSSGGQGDGTASRVQQLMHKTPLTCADHPTEILKHYCHTCAIPICNECLVGSDNHRQPHHKTDRIQDIEAAQREELQLVLTEGRNKVALCQKASTNLETRLGDLQLQRDQVKGQIEEAFHSYKALLEQRREALMAELEASHKRQELTIMELFHSVEKTIEKIEDGSRFAQRIVDNGNAPAILSVKKLVVDQLLHLFANTPNPNLEVSLEFETNMAAFNDAVFKNFGRLNGPSAHSNGSFDGSASLNSSVQSVSRYPSGVGASVPNVGNSPPRPFGAPIVGRENPSQTPSNDDLTSMFLNSNNNNSGVNQFPGSARFRQSGFDDSASPINHVAPNSANSTSGANGQFGQLGLGSRVGAGGAFTPYPNDISRSVGATSATIGNFKPATSIAGTGRTAGGNLLDADLSSLNQNQLSEYVQQMNDQLGGALDVSGLSPGILANLAEGLASNNLLGNLDSLLSILAPENGPATSVADVATSVASMNLNPTMQQRPSPLSGHHGVSQQQPRVGAINSTSPSGTHHHGDRSASRNSHSPTISESGISMDGSSQSGGSAGSGNASIASRLGISGANLGTAAGNDAVAQALFSKQGAGLGGVSINGNGQICLNGQVIPGVNINHLNSPALTQLLEALPGMGGSASGIPTSSAAGNTMDTPHQQQLGINSRALSSQTQSLSTASNHASGGLNSSGNSNSGVLSNIGYFDPSATPRPTTPQMHADFNDGMPSPNGSSGFGGGSETGRNSANRQQVAGANPGPGPGAGNTFAGGNHPPYPVRGPNSKCQAMQIRHKFGTLGPGKCQFNSPHGFCLGGEENIVVADTNNHRIQVFDKSGEFKFQFGIPGRDEGQLWYPRKVAVLRSSGKYVVCDRGNERSRMQIFTKNGHFIRKIAIRYIDIVAGLAIASSGNIVAVDSVSPTVFVIAESGELVRWFDCSDYMREPSDIAVSGKEFFVCDFKGHCVVVFSEEGQFLRRIGCENITNFPNGIDISDAGDVLVGDSHGNRFHVAVFQRDGSLLSEFECPYVKVSRCCGLKITSEGYVVTLAKNNHHVLVLNTLYIT